MNSQSSFWDRYAARRISRRRALQMAAIGGASAGAIALVGCSSDDDSDKTPSSGSPGAGGTTVSEGAPQPGGTLRGTVSLVLGKDPMKASTFLTHALASYSYSRLMRFKTQLGPLPQGEWYTPEPELAASVETPDPTTYIFTIRDDATFQNLPPVNGRNVTADDVVYSFNRYQSLSPNKANMAMVESVTASADKKQVTFKLKEPFGLFLNRIASFQDLWIMPQEFIEQSDTASEESMLGSGPFIFEKFEPGVVMSWRKNPDYWETDNGAKLPYLDGVNLAIITDQNQVLSQFAAGQLDTISVPPQLIESVRSQSADAVIDAAPRNILSMLLFEPASYTSNKPPFNDDRVRRGMSRALNRDALLSRISPDGGLWPSMPINAGFGETWWLDPQGSGMGEAAENYQYDVSAAKALFEAAGVSSIDVPMHFSSTVYTTVVPYYDIVREALPAMLGEAGVTANPVPEEYGQYIATTFAGQFDGFAFGLESVFSDIGAYWSNMFYPRDAGGGRNHSSVNDAELVANIQKMLQSQDVEDLREQNFELQRYVSSKMYYVPVVTPVEFAARQPRLKGVYNTTGPTTYALGTESTLHTWLVLDDRLPAEARLCRLTLIPQFELTCGGQSSTMRQYILKRLLLAIPTLIGVSLIVFFMVRLIPGDIVEQIQGDTPPTPEFRTQVERELGLDKPVVEQYFRWLAGVVRLDFGDSLRLREPVSELLRNKLPVTIEMSLLALMISLAIALPVGILSALRQDSLVDYVARSTAIGFLAVPTFWLGTLVIVYSSNWFTKATPLPQDYKEFWEDPYTNLQFLLFPFGYFIPVGPAVILGVSLSGTVMRLMRAQMLEVLRQDYVRTAWAKGLRERSVVLRHAMKNAMIPVVTVIGLQLPILISGSVVVESIYNVPGMGQFFFTSIATRDYTSVQAIALIVAVAVVFSNLIVDITYGYLDPRIRYS